MNKVIRLIRLITRYGGTPHGAARIAELHSKHIRNTLERELEREPTENEMTLALWGAQGWWEGFL